jgi:hypothetical protein
VSIDSHVQVKDDIEGELDKWIHHWSDKVDVTYEMKYDLVMSIYNSLRSGGALDPALTATTDYEDQQYN